MILAWKLGNKQKLVNESQMLVEIDIDLTGLCFREKSTRKDVPAWLNSKQKTLGNVFIHFDYTFI